jgi:hypothetical protein
MRYVPLLSVSVKAPDSIPLRMRMRAPTITPPDASLTIPVSFARQPVSPQVEIIGWRPEGGIAKVDIDRAAVRSGADAVTAYCAAGWIPKSNPPLAFARTTASGNTPASLKGDGGEAATGAAAETSVNKSLRMGSRSYTILTGVTKRSIMRSSRRGMQSGWNCGLK